MADEEEENSFQLLPTQPVVEVEATNINIKDEETLEAKNCDKRNNSVVEILPLVRRNARRPSAGRILRYVFCWLRLEVLVALLALGLFVTILNAEIMYGSFLTFAFYRAISPFEYQAYAQSMASEFGNHGLNPGYLDTVYKKHLNLEVGRKYLNFVWKYDDCVPGNRHCIALRNIDDNQNPKMCIECTCQGVRKYDAAWDIHEREPSKLSECCFKAADDSMSNINETVNWQGMAKLMDCYGKYLSKMSRGWMDHIHMSWGEWLLHIEINPLYLLFSKLFQTPFDLLINWIFVAVVITLLLKLIANCILFISLDPLADISWRKRATYLTYPISVPTWLVVGFMLFVVLSMIRSAYIYSGWNNIYADKITKLAVYLCALIILILMLWVITVRARQNPQHGWMLCINIRKFMMKKPKDLAHFFLTVYQIGTESASDLAFSRSVSDDNLLCLICHEDINREELEQKPGAVPALVCRHIYHASCLIQWLEKSEKCPYCQDSVLLQKAFMRHSPDNENQSSSRRFVNKVIYGLHVIASRFYFKILTVLCTAVRNCCYLCRLWFGFFIYFIAITVVLVLLRRISIKGYDGFVYNSIRRKAENECALFDIER